MRKYFITGLLILVPLAITAWVLNLVISTMDQSLLFVPERWQPRTLIGFDIPGLGTLLTIVIVFLTGLLTNNLVGNYVVKLWEKLLTRIPVVSSLYSSVKQVSDTLFSSSGNAFRKAVLIPYPHQNSWTIAFLTRAGRGREEPPGRRVRQRVRADHAESDLGLFPDAGQEGCGGTRHVGRCRPEVHRFDGRGGAGRRAENHRPG